MKAHNQLNHCCGTLFCLITHDAVNHEVPDTLQSMLVHRNPKFVAVIKSIQDKIFLNLKAESADDLVDEIKEWIQA